MGCHMSIRVEVAPTWRHGGKATSARGRRRYGGDLAGERRHGDECEWYQKEEGSVGSLVLTKRSPEAAAIAGGDAKSGDVVRVDGGEGLRWVSDDGEVRTR